MSKIGRWIPTFEGRCKAVRIPIKAYDKLLELKRREMEKAKQEKDLDKLGMLTAMDSGAFTGYLIYKMARNTERAEG